MELTFYFFLHCAAYQHAFQVANYIAELFRPDSAAFAELW